MCIILALVAAFYKELLAMSFDETFARIRNVPVDALYYMLLGMIALTVVMLMRVVGLILVIALLTIPAAVSNQWVKNLKAMMFLAVLLGMVFTTVGLFLSYWLNLTSGAAIILVAAAGYILSALIQNWRNSRHVMEPDPGGKQFRCWNAPSQTCVEDGAVWNDCSS